MAEEIEKIYVIPLKKTGCKGSKSAPSAIKRVKTYLTRHMKAEEKDIWIDDSLNNALWSQGMYNIPSKIRVKAVKFDDGVVEAYIPELEFKKSRRELLREEREKKEPILRKEEVEGEEAEGEATGAEDYEIAPTGEGDVKIKKKKAPKEKKEKKEDEKKPSGKKKEKEEKPKEEKKEKTPKKAKATKTTKEKKPKKPAKKTSSKPKSPSKKKTSSSKEKK